MPEFEVTYEIARYLSGSRYGTAGAELSRAMQAYSSPVHRNGATAVRVSVIVADNRDRGSSFSKRNARKRAIEFLFRNMPSSAIVSGTRNSL
jgi:hypothetical protein